MLKKHKILTAVVLATVTGAALSTAALADRMGYGQMDGHGMHDGMMGDGPMGWGNRDGFGGPDGRGGSGMGPMAGFDFAAVDADSDGKITQDELTAFRAAEATKIDANGDGKLSAEELAAPRIAEMTDRITAMTTEMIARMDTDGDGLLSAAELVTRPLPAMLFERADADGDGAVTQAEIDALRGQGKGGHDRRGQRFWDRQGMMGQGYGQGNGQGMGQGNGNGQGNN
jgi:hypothetical protein